MTGLQTFKKMEWRLSFRSKSKILTLSLLRMCAHPHRQTHTHNYSNNLLHHFRILILNMAPNLEVLMKCLVSNGIRIYTLSNTQLHILNNVTRHMLRGVQMIKSLKTNTEVNRQPANITSQ